MMLKLGIPEAKDVIVGELAERGHWIVANVETTSSWPLGGFVLRLAALLVFLTTAAVAWIIASGFGHDGQHLGLGGLLLYSTLLADAIFHELLLAYDRDLADTAREAGCPCGGVLHSAKYPRKPRPWLCRLGLEHQRRFSYCCAVDGCRCRATPPSLRFLGRKVYLATIVVLVSMMQHGVTERRMRAVKISVAFQNALLEMGLILFVVVLIVGGMSYLVR